MLDSIELLIFLLIVSLATLVSRVLPFVLFSSNRKIPNYVNYLGKVLPYCMTGFLIIYCLKDISFTNYPFGIAEIIAIVCVALLHIWKKKTILSIIGGTIIYMVLVQFVFI